MGALGLALALWVLLSVCVSLLLAVAVRSSRGPSMPVHRPAEQATWLEANSAVSIGTV